MTSGDTASEPSIRVETRGGCTTILLDRPQVLNALHTPMHFELEAAFDRFAADPVQRVCVVQGVGGRAFCAGSDLKYASAMREAGRQDELRYPPHGYAGLIERFDLAKPVIAAVDGVAFGGGFELALACDLIVATTRSRFALPEPRIGAVALAGGVHRLARQVGLKQAMQVALTAEPISAETGYRMGFVNDVVAPEALDAAVQALVDAILRNAPFAIAATKQAMMRGLDEPDLAHGMRHQWSYDAFAAWRESGEMWEGAKAFTDKRLPAWRAE